MIPIDPEFRSLLAINALLRAELIAVRRQLEAWRAQEAKYNPNWAQQPRAPRGSPDGGQWVDGDGGTPVRRPAPERNRRPARLRTPRPANDNAPARVPLRLLRAAPLTLPLLLTGDTPQSVVTANVVAATNDPVLVDTDDRRLGRHFAEFRRIVTPGRQIPLIVFGVDIGLATDFRSPHVKPEVLSLVDLPYYWGVIPTA